MESHFILTWSLTALVLLSSALFFIFRNRNREKRTLSVLHAYARENHSTLTTFDHWPRSLIGIDEKDTVKLFFIRKERDREIREVIDLSEVKSCILVKAERTVRQDKEKVSLIEKIELVLTYSAGDKPVVALEFYNNDYDSLTLLGELQLAQKWLEIVKNAIETTKRKNRMGFTAKSEAPANKSAGKKQLDGSPTGRRSKHAAGAKNAA